MSCRYNWKTFIFIYPDSKTHWSWIDPKIHENCEKHVIWLKVQMVVYSLISILKIYHPTLHFTHGCRPSQYIYTKDIYSEFLRICTLAYNITGPNRFGGDRLWHGQVNPWVSIAVSWLAEKKGKKWSLSDDDIAPARRKTRILFHESWRKNWVI